MAIKPAVIVTVSDGVPNCYAVGDIASIHEEFRSLKKSGLPQDFDEAYELNAIGIGGRAKFDRKPKVTKKKAPSKKEG